MTNDGHTGTDQLLSGLVDEFVRDRLLAEQRHIDEVCLRAREAGHGVRVDRYPSRTVAVVDPTIPTGELHEHQHTAADGYRRWADLTHPEETL